MTPHRCSDLTKPSRRQIGVRMLAPGRPSARLDGGRTTSFKVSRSLEGLFGPATGALPQPRMLRRRSGKRSGGIQRP
jgi:hypothetical protein